MNEWNIWEIYFIGYIDEVLENIFYSLGIDFHIFLLPTSCFVLFVFWLVLVVVVLWFVLLYISYINAAELSHLLPGQLEHSIMECNSVLLVSSFLTRKHKANILNVYFSFPDVTDYFGYLIGNRYWYKTTACLPVQCYETVTCEVSRPRV